MRKIFSKFKKSLFLNEKTANLSLKLLKNHQKLTKNEKIISKKNFFLKFDKSFGFCIKFYTKKVFSRLKKLKSNSIKTLYKYYFFFFPQKKKFFGDYPLN